MCGFETQLNSNHLLSYNFTLTKALLISTQSKLVYTSVEKVLPGSLPKYFNPFQSVCEGVDLGCWNDVRRSGETVPTCYVCVLSLNVSSLVNSSSQMQKQQHALS